MSKPKRSKPKRIRIPKAKQISSNNKPELNFVQSESVKNKSLVEGLRKKFGDFEIELDDRMRDELTKLPTKTQFDIFSKYLFGKDHESLLRSGQYLVIVEEGNKLIIKKRKRMTQKEMDAVPREKKFISPITKPVVFPLSKLIWGKREKDEI